MIEWSLQPMTRSPLDWGKARRHHQAVALVDQVACFIGELEVRLPLRIGHHGSALARAVGHILEDPQVNERVDVPALPVQIGEWRPEVTGLRCEPALGIKVKLLRHLARSDAIGAYIDDHGDTPSSRMPRT